MCGTIIAVLPPAVLHWARLGEVPQLRLGEAVDTAGCRWEDALSTTSGLVTRAAEVMAIAFKQISLNVKKHKYKNTSTVCFLDEMKIYTSLTKLNF